MSATLMTCAGAYLLGVLTTPDAGASFSVLFAINIIIIAAIISIRKRRVKWLMFAAAILFALGSVRTFTSLESPLYYTLPEKYVTVTGTVVSTPMKSHGDYKYESIVYVDSLSYLDKDYKISEKMKIASKQQWDYGKRVQASGFLRDFKDKNNENDFDNKLYYGGKGIRLHMSAYEITEMPKIANTHFSGRLRDKFYKAIKSKFSGTDAALLYAVILGDKSYITGDYHAKLLATGVIHSVYSPYMHILLMTFIAGFFFRKNRKLRDAALLGMMVFYALYNSAMPTSLKAVLFAALLILDKYIMGFVNRADCLAVVVMVMIIINPLLCFNGAFAISVVSTFLIYAVYMPLCDIIKKRTGKFKGPVYTVSLCAVLIFGTIPLDAYYFCGISPYTMIFAPLLMPFVSFVVLTSPAVLLIPGGISIPVIGELFTGAFAILKGAPYIIERLPFHHIMLAKPHILGVIAYYLLFWAVFRCICGKGKTDLTKNCAALAAAFSIALMPIADINALKLFFVNVGQGDGAVLSTGIGETILIDGGGAPAFQTDYNVGESVYLPYLVSHGLTNVDTAVVSHYHKDHVEGIITAAENLRIKRIAMPDTAPDNEYRKKLEQIAGERNIEILYLKEGDELVYRSGLKLKILAPDDEQLSGTDENDTSIVAEVHYGKFTALFTGDSGDKVNENYARNIDILKAAHHGSETSNDMDFVEHVRPKYTVISVGDDNEYDLPSDLVVSRYKQVGSDILRTDELGDIRFRVTRKGAVKYETFRRR